MTGIDHIGNHIGIDPGKSGGVAIIFASGNVEVHKMPDTDQDLYELLFDIGSESHAVVEQVNAMPTDGRTSAFQFGRNYGAVRMALTCCGVPYELVTPQKWQKGIGVAPRKKIETKADHKRKLRQLAQELFPRIKLTHATCDALLIAEYGRRLLMRQPQRNRT